MTVTLLGAAGLFCVLYTCYEIGRLIQSARDGAHTSAFAYDVETGERIPLFVERRRRERRAD